MRRWAAAGAVTLAIGSAAVLYWISYETGRLEARVQVLDRTLDRVEADIAAARAELAHLSRPDRIAPLAQAMGLVPPTAQQFVAEDQLPRRVREQP